MPADDGAMLATDVYLPADSSPTALVVMRTPYGKNSHRDEGIGWSERGLGFVVQDVRGRYDSDGVWDPYLSERSDGASLASWIATQPWDCPVFAVGASYSSFTAWAMAVSAPSSVSGVISMVPAMGLRPVKFDPSGILRLAEHASWWVEHCDARVSRTGIAAAMFAASPNLLSYLPVVDIGERMWASVSGLGRAFEDDSDPEALTDRELSALPMPSLHIGGWNDLLAPETLHQWEITGRSDLVVGPWDHALVPTGRLQAAWIEAVLSSRRLSPAELASCLTRPSSSGSASMPTSSGLMTFAFPGDTLTLERELPVGCVYSYDQNNPFPSRARTADRRVLDERDDAVRSFVDCPSEAVLSGRPVVSLQASSDAPSVDWIVHLVERFADGRVVSIADGAAIDDLDRITLSPLRHELSPGSRLSIEVSSSDFPRLARNLGTGDNRYTTGKMRPSRQYVESIRVELPIESPTQKSDARMLEVEA